MTTLLAFAFVFGLVVLFHEAGHFFTAKIIGVRVKVFSFGFPPKLIGRKWGDTEYQLCLLPIGGYVKMAGDNPLDATGDPREFMSRTKWERLAIYFAGPLMNLVLTIGILTVLFMVGMEKPAGLDDPAMVRFVAEDSPASRSGVRPGDQIVAIDGSSIETWSDAIDAFIVHANDTLTLTLLRDGERIEKDVLVETRTEDQIPYTGLLPPVQPKVTSLSDDFPAKAAGMQEGDIITRVDDKPIFHFEELIDAIESKGGERVSISVLRGNETINFELTPKRANDRWLIGIQFDSAPMVIHQIRNPVLALGAAVNESGRLIRLLYVVLGRLVTGQASVRQMSGPIGIAEASGETARRGAKALFSFVAFLSINLGILNLLPIPLLDGGHMAIIALEGLAGRDFSLQVKERILQVGLVMLLLLMATVIYVDLSRIDAIGKYLPW
ncbi:MAG TPA: RIP metalloprotease RseP [Vicinamibacteria bacterium]|nr:RIP metalloprotease RseP [Vicinamibacteria bacterium]